MNTQQLRKLTNILLTALFSVNTISCIAQDKVFTISEIYTAIKVEEKEYEFSEESYVEFEGNHYSLRQKAIYDDNGGLLKFILYKPEGKIEYQKEDFEKDKDILKYSGMPLKQQWVFENNKLKKGSQTVDVQKVNDSLIKADTGIKTTFYKLRQ